MCHKSFQIVQSELCLRVEETVIVSKLGEKSANNALACGSLVRPKDMEDQLCLLEYGRSAFQHLGEVHQSFHPPLVQIVHSFGSVFKSERQSFDQKHVVEIFGLRRH
eukprot:Lithocolla_globosa_v1_NODE_120_length_6112_cov_229.957240.p3 type:complete len:107 gc:universal NODE_120_length_6112_cov_229.957240:1106-786(-)